MSKKLRRGGLFFFLIFIPSMSVSLTCSDIFSNAHPIQKNQNSLRALFNVDWFADPRNWFNSNADFNKFLELSNRPHNKIIPSKKFFKSNLSKEELAGLLEYTADGGYSKINRLYRNNNYEDVIRSCPQCLHIESALQKIPKYEGIVYRGARNGIPDSVRAEYLKVGNVVTEKSFLSTSRYADRTLFDGDRRSAYFIIRSLSGRSVEKISPNIYEGEILFSPNTKFKIISVSNNGNDSFTILMDEVVSQ